MSLLKCRIKKQEEIDDVRSKVEAILRDLLGDNYDMRSLASLNSILLREICCRENSK